MSSLYSYFKSGAFRWVRNSDLTEAERQLLAEAEADLVSHKYTLVRISDIYREIEDLAAERGFYFTTKDEWLNLPPCTPPFERLWMEGSANGMRRCAILLRDHLKTAVGEWLVLILAGMWDPYEGLVMGVWDTTLWLGQSGRIVDVRENTNLTPEEEERVGCDARGLCFIVAHALARMNCRNVSLAVARDSTPKKRKLSLVPSVVWHEIVVQPISSLKSTTSTADGEHRIIRSHWVRGHYADYTAGAGLFGRIKGVFWFPEHRRGDESAGSVISTYRIATPQKRIRGL